jgi:nitroreductase/NAD-dependent dihydropyrimidine dehydrogenase PreA subunit
MLDFIVNKQACTGCGQCADDCPASIIAMDDGYPGIDPEKEASCYKCQHCLAICPTGAVSILGLDPEESDQLTGNMPDAGQMETLLRGRRSVRHYKEENLEPELLVRLLDVACHAPSGMNARQVRFTVVDDREKLAKLRDEVMTGLGRMAREGALPKGREFFADFVRMWEEDRTDVLFRGAPHLVIASAPNNIATPIEDCLIALSYFELFAQSLGIGTVWEGLVNWVLNELLPETRKRLGIPDNHVIGFAMAFGRPAVSYSRTTQHAPANIYFVS